jgi:thiaminase/transcriptional activator TenA
VVGTLPVTWSDNAWRSVQPTYAQILEHPFVQQLQAGTLAQDIFLRYLLDDARYLSGYARALAMISGRLPDTADVALLARSAAGAVEAERVMHAALLGEHGIDIDGPGEPSPTCRLYTSSLISAVATEPVEVALAAVLPGLCRSRCRDSGRHSAGPPVFDMDSDVLRSGVLRHHR